MGAMVRRFASRLVALAVLCGFVSLQIFDPYPIELLRLNSFDYYQRLKPRDILPPDKKQVTIVAIDEASLLEYGPWPWPRALLADLARKLQADGAKVVAFDIVFAETRRGGGDAAFTEAVREGRVVLGFGTYQKKIIAPVRPPLEKNVTVMGNEKVDIGVFLPSALYLLRNLAELESAAAGHGVFSLPPEADGKARRVPTTFSHDGRLYPAFAVEILRVAFRENALSVELNKAGIERVGVGKEFYLPTDAQGRVWLYFSKSDRDKYVSVKDVLNDTADPDLLRGKIVIVGADAVGLMDIHPSPVEASMAGVEIHAQFVEQALQGAFLHRPANFRGGEFVFLIFCGLLFIAFVPKLPAIRGLFAYLVSVGAVTGFSWYLFSQHRMLFDASLPAAALTALYMVLVVGMLIVKEAKVENSGAI